jgi:hypothetical protein
MDIATILSQVDLGSIALPAFQRGYVWNRDQVRKLMQSLYRRHPVGSLLVWVTSAEQIHARDDGAPAPGPVELLLDGQQRITSLYGIIRGKPPAFFEGNAQAFSGLYFNLDDESFEFYGPVKMKDNPYWINVTELMKIGVGEAINRLLAIPDVQPRLPVYINRLNALAGIKDIVLHIEKIVGEDKTADVVAEIFNNVNSGGTQLSKGDLALAKICAGWPDARNQMNARLEAWRKAGFDFTLEWLLRNITTVLKGEAFFSALEKVETKQFQNGLQQAEEAINYLLNMVAGRLGLDHDRVLGGRYALPVMSRYVTQSDGKLKDAREQDKLLYWYVHSFLWGRFAGSTETVLSQDLNLLKQHEGGLDRLIDQIRRSRGDLRIRPEDFSGWSLGARFYPMLYLMTRVCQARDWGSGLPLTAHMLGKLNRLQVHHIFPKALLYKRGYTKAEANAITNFCFLTQGTNLNISDQYPEVYFEAIAQAHPGALESQWIPMDRTLWKLEHYRAFLWARQELLAQAANQFLDGLLHGPTTSQKVEYPTTLQIVSDGAADATPAKAEIGQLIAWLETHHLPKPELDFVLSDPDTSEILTILDAAWPQGLQEGYSDRVALVLEQAEPLDVKASQLGYRVFTNLPELQRYIEREILANGQ